MPRPNIDYLKELYPDDSQTCGPEVAVRQLLNYAIELEEELTNIKECLASLLNSKVLK